MALFDKQIAIVRQQLGALETSQRMAIFLCGIIVMGSVLMLSQWSLQQEMVPLYAEVLSEDERNEVVRQLKMYGETFEEKDEAIWVKPDDRRGLLMKLAMSESGPQNTRLTFMDLIKESNNFVSQSKTQWQQNIALQNELAMVIEENRKIKIASVFIAHEDKRALLQRPSEPKATVKVTMAGGARLGKKLAYSLAALVSSTVPRLDPKNVTVVDLGSGLAIRGGDGEDELSTRLHELRHQEEKRLQEKIEDILSYIPGVIVGVSVTLDEQVVNSVETKLDRPDMSREKTKEEQFSNQASGMEPGVDANTGFALTGGGNGSSKTITESEVEYLPQRGGKVTETMKKPGAVVEASASIQIPRSYLVGEYKTSAPSPESEPSESDLETIALRKIDTIEAAIHPILISKTEPEINVSVYSDTARYVMPEFATEEGAETVASTQVMDIVKTHGKQIGLGALALVAMGMMMQMSRKTTSSMAVLKDAEKAFKNEQLDDLTLDNGPIGEAGMPEGFLIAPETDEDSIRSRQISKQVEELVKEDPEGASQLVRRWIERDG